MAAALAMLLACGAAAPRGDDLALAPLEPLLAPATVLLLGEIHGTVEAPAMVSRIVARALAQGQSVSVALEIPREEQPVIDAFLSTAGSRADRENLLAGPFWQSRYQDGRASEAMATLLDDLRGHVVSGEPLRVALIDRHGLRGAEREQAMAEALAAIVSSAPGDFTLTLVGNLHARLARGAGLGVAESMALRAGGMLPEARIVSLRLVHSDGTAWVCGGHRSHGCGISALAGNDSHASEKVTLEQDSLAGDSRLVGGFHGTLALGAIHASPPALKSHRTPEAMATTYAGTNGHTHSTTPVAPARAADKVRNPISALDPDGEWPHWMGPARTGQARADGFLSPERPIDLAVAWRRPIGNGFSSISVAGGRAFTLAAEDGEDWLLALDVGDGREIWRTRIDEASRETPSSTPAISGDAVFALNPRGKLVAASTDGTVLWSRDLQATLGAVPHSYGMSTSPLLVDGLVTVLVGGLDNHNLVAFHQRSGEIAWSVAHAKWGSYASPTLLTLADERQIVAPADDLLYAVRPGDGSLLWSIAGLGELDRMPLPLPGDRIFLARETGAVLLRLGRQGDRWQVKEEWRTPALKHSYSPAVYLEGVLYGFDGPFLTAIDSRSAALLWRQKVGDGTLILVDRHLVVLGNISGLLRIIEARPDRFDERAAIQVLSGDEAYAAPSYAGGRIFVRNKSEIAAVDIGGG